MKRTKLLSFFIALILILISLAACEVQVSQRLERPTLTLLGDMVSWESVDGAIGYELDDGSSIIILTKSAKSYTIAEGESIRVRALGDGVNKLTSRWSDTVTRPVHEHTDNNSDSVCDICDEKIQSPSPDSTPNPNPEPDPIKLATPKITLNGNTVFWNAVPNASGYELDTGAGVIKLGKEALSYTLNDSATVCLRAIGNGTEYLTSAWSAEATYKKSESAHTHKDTDENGICDTCQESVIVIIDIYSINDLHGKFCDTSGQPGVDELATLLKSGKNETIILSSGDMFQGSAESNLTGGNILTEWMNSTGFDAMTLGNHEFDWGEDAIRENLAIAEFPFLAINVYDRTTGKLADYCTPSVFIDLGDVEVGVIGAIGDCYSSISRDKVENVYFKTGDELAGLVETEAARLRSIGADLIIYSLHDGYGSSGNKSINTSLLSYYQSRLADDVDIVFEGHSHQSYVLTDTNGTKHLQGGGENSGISHAEIHVNFANDTHFITTAEVIRSSVYSSLADDPATEAVEQKYIDVINEAYEPLGTLGKAMSSDTIADEVARLYLEAGLEKWGSKYNIVLGGGYISTRSPYKLTAGQKSYADVLSVLPFDNQLVLCKISGSKLSSRFVNTTNSDYHNAYSAYGSSVKNNISSSATYYVVVDTYTMLYAANGLTLVEYYDNTTFARDLLAAAIKEKEYE